MDIYAQIIEKIIRAQEAIIGPVAVEQANRVPHLKIDWGEEHNVSIDGNEVQTVNKLIEVYQELFGQISKEVSKEAATPLLGKLSGDKLPSALR